VVVVVVEVIAEEKIVIVEEVEKEVIGMLISIVRITALVDMEVLGVMYLGEVVVKEEKRITLIIVVVVIILITRMQGRSIMRMKRGEVGDLFMTLRDLCSEDL
jgi:hypothetical protein